MANDDPRAAPFVCAHALDTSGTLPDLATIAGCPVCWRRWRLAEARLRGWTPLDAATARPLIERMAAEAAAGVDAAPLLSQGFYAFLAGSPEDEDDFAAACVVAFAPTAATPPRRQRADFGWRAIFADLAADTSAPIQPTAPATSLTRVWEWRERTLSGTAPRREARAFVRGESPPPFAPLHDTAAQWVRERATYDGAETTREMQQIVGPLALRLAGAGGDGAILTLRLRGGTGLDTVPVRLYSGGGTDAPLWAGVLSSGAEEATIPLDRATSLAFTLEFDTAW